MSRPINTAIRFRKSDYLFYFSLRFFLHSDQFRRREYSSCFHAATVEVEQKERVSPRDKKKTNGDRCEMEILCCS